MKNFIIADYEVCENSLIAYLQKNCIQIPITLPTSKFEQWLRHNDRLSWELNTTDNTGEHLQFHGTMSIDEYWNTDKKYIKADLYDYITRNPITFRGEVYTDSMANIMLAFDIHEAGRSGKVSTSNCCGAENRMTGEDIDFLEMGRCPDCLENCEFIEAELEPIDGAFAD